MRKLAIVYDTVSRVSDEMPARNETRAPDLVFLPGPRSCAIRDYRSPARRICARIPSLEVDIGGPRVFILTSARGPRTSTSESR